MMQPRGRPIPIGGGEWLSGIGSDYKVLQADLMAIDVGPTCLIYPIALVKKFSSSKIEYVLRTNEYRWSPIFFEATPRFTAEWKFVTGRFPNPYRLVRALLTFSSRIQDSVSGSFQFLLALQPVGFEESPGLSTVNLNVQRPTCSSWTTLKGNTPIRTRVLVMLADDSSVSVVGFPELPLAGTTSHLINATATRVFQTADEYTKIRNADLFAECFSAPTATASSMILTVTTARSGRDQKMSWIRLDEFAQHDYFCVPFPPASNLARNLVVYRGPNGSCFPASLTACNLGSFLNGTVCQPRSVTNIPIPFLVRSSFFRLAPAALTLIPAVREQHSFHRCSHWKGVSYVDVHSS